METLAALQLVPSCGRLDSEIRKELAKEDARGEKLPGALKDISHLLAEEHGVSLSSEKLCRCLSGDLTMGEGSFSALAGVSSLQKGTSDPLARFVAGINVAELVVAQLGLAGYAPGLGKARTRAGPFLKPYLEAGLADADQMRAAITTFERAFIEQVERGARDLREPGVRADHGDFCEEGTKANSRMQRLARLQVAELAAQKAARGSGGGGKTGIYASEFAALQKQVAALKKAVERSGGGKIGGGAPAAVTDSATPEVSVHRGIRNKNGVRAPILLIELMSGDGPLLSGAKAADGTPLVSGDKLCSMRLYGRCDGTRATKEGKTRPCSLRACGVKPTKAMLERHAGRMSKAAEDAFKKYTGDSKRSLAEQL